MINIHPDYVDMVDALNDQRVEFILVGAYAVGFHGHPRLSADFDILIRPTAENISKANAALKAFGAPFCLDLEDLKAGKWSQLGVKPVRIDLIGGIDGVPTERVWANRVRGRFAGRDVWFISYEDLIANKRAAGRGKDLLDVEALEKVKKAGQRPRRQPRQPEAEG